MNNTFFYTVAVALALTVAGCRSTPRGTEIVDASPVASTSASASASSSASASPVTTERLCITEEGVRLLPDTAATPGKLCTANDLDFDGLKYAAKVPVCRANITDKMKSTVAKMYGIKDADVSNFVFEHYVPLSIGGANDVANIWPQPKEFVKAKNDVEEAAYAQLKDGKITQDAAVALVKDWKPADCK